jgi:hypothetical protein
MATWGFFKALVIVLAQSIKKLANVTEDVVNILVIMS